MKKILVFAIVLVPVALFSAQAARVETNAPQIPGMQEHAALISHLDLPTQKLHEAAKVGNADLIGALLEQGAHVNGCDTRGATPLHWAVLKGHLECVKTLVIKGRARVNAQTNEGMTALHFAAYNDYGAIVTFLLENQAQLNLRNKLQKTALTCAFSSQKGIGLSCTILLKNGANIADLPGIVRKPIPYCAMVNSLGTLRYLLRGSCTQEEKNLALVLAVRFKRTDCIEVLLAHGADPDVSIHISIPYLLSQTGSNVTLTSPQLYSALHFALIACDDKTVGLLLKAGANKEYYQYTGIKPEMRLRPLALACKRGRITLVKKLIEAGAQINGLSAHGSTALHVAAFEGTVESLQLLLDSNAFLDQQDIYGTTALLFAHQRKSTPHVELLRGRGATLDFLDANPLYMACKSGDKEALIQAVRVSYSLMWRLTEKDNTELSALIPSKVKETETVTRTLLSFYQLNEGVVPSFEESWREAAVDQLIVKLRFFFTALRNASFVFHENIADLCNPDTVEKNFSEIIKAGIDERVAELESKKTARGAQTSTAEIQEPDTKKRKVTDTEGTPDE